MSQDDPLPETKKPVLIVSDGEEGHLVEKVIVERSEKTSAKHPLKTINNAPNSRDEDHTPPRKKGS